MSAVAGAIERKRIAVVIPCYNEAQTLGAVVRGCVPNGDVFVIDDGSTDDSAKIARDEGASVVPTGGRQGYEKVIEQGLRHCYERGYDFVITIDADGEHDPAISAAFVDAFARGTLLVIGYRPAPQRLAEWMVCLYCRRRFGIRDVLCGMKGYGRPVLENYFADGRNNLLNIWPALLWRAAGRECEQILVTGERRQDQPRFNSRIKANLRIAEMMKPICRL